MNTPVKVQVNAEQGRLVADLHDEYRRIIANWPFPRANGYEFPEVPPNLQHGPGDSRLALQVAYNWWRTSICAAGQAAAALGQRDFASEALALLERTHDSAIRKKIEADPGGNFLNVVGLTRKGGDWSVLVNLAGSFIEAREERALQKHALHL